MENVKIYGITKIAKEVIEISDHISQAKKTLLKTESQDKHHVLWQLEKVHSELRRLFHKYHIE
jgi:molecular chaperone GrpE (heat shock protein)